MATYYYDGSLASGLNDGTSWTDAYQTLQAALTAATVVDDIIYVKKSSLETFGSDTSLAVNAVHTKLAPLRILVVDDAASDAPVSTYGTSGNGELNVSGAFEIKFITGSVYVWGLRYIFRDSAAATDFTENVTFERCYYFLNSTGGEKLTSGTADVITFIDTDIDFSSGNHQFDFTNDCGHFRMFGGSITASGTSGTLGLVAFNSTKSGIVRLYGVDLSAFNSARPLIEIPTANAEHIVAEFVNCKFGGTRNPITVGNPIFMPQSDVISISGSEAYLREEQQHNGKLTTSTTIYRNSGATDGTTNFSFDIASTANATERQPFRVLLAAQNYGNLSGRTLKIHFAQNAGAPTAIKDVDVWITAYSPTSGAIDSRYSRGLPLASGTNLTDESGSEDWRNGGGALSGYTEQSMSLSGFGTTEGVVRIYLNIAADYSTNNLFVCPKIEIA